MDLTVVVVAGAVVLLLIGTIAKETRGWYHENVRVTNETYR